MNVNDFNKYISKYVDGDLKSSDVKKFEELLKNNSECKEKFQSYQTMLNELSDLKVLTTSDDFLNKLHDRINKSSQLTFIQKIEKINIFGYDYISISGIAAAITMFIFSVSIFMKSDSIPGVNLNELSTRNTQKNPELLNNNYHLLSQDDTLIDSKEVDIPKIHRVGGKK